MKENESQKVHLIKNDSKSIAKLAWKYRWYYVMVAPLIIWYLVFCYVPMYGVTLAFKDFKFNLGILGSPWNGIANFIKMQKDAKFWRAFINTIIISFGKLLFHFPLPIILAIIMNELSRNKLARFFQTIFTFPHLISWIVIAGIISNIFSSNGVVNQVLGTLGLPSFSPLTSTKYFRPLVYVTHIWKEIGWDSIIFMATLTGINPELYEAATIDGANRFQRILHVSWPGIRSTVAIMLILHVGNTMSIGGSFDQIFNMYSAPVYSVADTIDTFIYRTTFLEGSNYGYMTAIGMFKSVVNLALIIIANKVVKLFGEQGLY